MLRKLIYWKSGYFFCTPRWYSYGGMFHSIFLAVNLARHYGKRPVFFYPRKHFVRERFYSGFLNRELMEFLVEGERVRNGSVFQKVVSLWLDFNRFLYKEPYLRRALSGFCRLLGLRLERIVPLFLGYCGLENSSSLSRLLGISDRVNWNQIFAEATPIDLTEYQEQRGRKILQEMGIPAGRPFVCLYVRDGGFDSKRKASGQRLENADIRNFDSMISFLGSRGFYVVRVGEPNMVPFKSRGTKFIDYVHTPFYCELMDLFLYRHCAFWVGAMGGVGYAPIAYGRPCVVVNGVYPAYSGYCVRHDDVYLPKHLYSKELGRFLCLREQLETMNEFGEGGGYESGKYVAVENTPEEICTAVTEFYQSQFASKCDWRLDLQKEYWSLKERRGKEEFYNPVTKEWKTITLEQTAHLRPYISRRFLEDCWEVSPYLTGLSDYYNRNGSLHGFDERQSGYGGFGRSIA